MRLLILGGTTEASRLAAALAAAPCGVEATLSLAGRTVSPAAQPLATRSGGFGGVEGLLRYLDDHAIGAVLDATHPFAAQMSAHAAEACGHRGVPLAVFSRAPWQPGPGDRWTMVADLAAAANALGMAPRRVLLTSGRLGLAAFKATPQHDYLVRTIDPPDAADRPPQTRLLLARGPFSLADETALMVTERIDVLVSKNSGGSGEAKLAAARALGLPVVMVERPSLPAGTHLTDLPAVLGWIAAQRGTP